MNASRNDCGSARATFQRRLPAGTVDRRQQLYGLKEGQMETTDTVIVSSQNTMQQKQR
jgi:hypothetical protein